MRILVTGAAGSLGQALLPMLDNPGWQVAATDMETLNVTAEDEVATYISVYKRHAPDVIFHLAASKHAPEGEVMPAEVARTNVIGTLNVVEAAKWTGAKVVLASSCKACDPETVYGASKLIAERMVLNAGGSVARFFNIPESSGNVFELWRSLPEDEPIPVTPCTRYFQSLDRAVGLLLALVSLPAGRYCVDPGPARRMVDVAAELYPGRQQQQIRPRRGDRLHEPLCASHEQMVSVSGIFKIESPYDPVPAREAVAA